MRKRLTLFTSILFALSAQAYADIQVDNAYARAMAPTATTSAVFVTLSNSGDQPVSLLSASTPRAGKVELHDMIKQGDVMKMRQVPQIDIPAHGQTLLQPGSLHVMLFDLESTLKEGEKLQVTLNFSNQQSLVVEAPVKNVMMGMQMKQTKQAHQQQQMKSSNQNQQKNN